MPTTMKCPCRKAPLRTFIRGLAQVHKLETSTSSFWLHVPRSAGYPQRLVATRQTRPFHQSRQLRQDPPACKSTPPAELDEESSPDSSKTVDNATGVPVDEGEGLPSTRSNGEQRPWKAIPATGESAATPRMRGGKPRGPAQHDPDTQMPKKHGYRRADKKSPQPREDTRPSEKKEEWQLQKEALKKKFPEGWRPRKRLSPDALAGIRALQAQFPDVYTTETLAQKFEVSPENIRRILKSKWRASPEEEEARQERWHRRGQQIWERKAVLGIKPPRKWRQEGIKRGSNHHARRQHAIQHEKELEEEERERYREYRATLHRDPSKVL